MKNNINVWIFMAFIMATLFLGSGCEKDSFLTSGMEDVHVAPKEKIENQEIDSMLTTDVSPNEKSSGVCKDLSISLIKSTLNSFFTRMELRLDKNDTYLKYQGKKVFQTTIPSYTVKKPAYDWVYYVKDVRTESIRISTEGNFFLLSLFFEGNGSEIKGIAPNCKLCNHDRRAPDMNWKGQRRVDVYLRPISYENSISLDVAKVKMYGHFELNGHLDDWLFRKLADKQERNVKEKISAALHKALQESYIKDEISKQVRQILQRLNLYNSRSVQIFGNRIQFCTDQVYIGFRNRYRVNAYLYVDNNHNPKTFSMNFTWKYNTKFQWSLEPVLGTEYYRLKNRFTGLYLHNEYGRPQSGSAPYTWWSSHWELIKVPNTNTFQIRNRHRYDQYFHTEYGPLRLNKIQPGWWSAQWELKPFIDF